MLLVLFEGLQMSGSNVLLSHVHILREEPTNFLHECYKHCLRPEVGEGCAMVSLFNVFTVTLPVPSMAHLPFCSWTWTVSLQLVCFSFFKVNHIWSAQGSHLVWWGKYLGVCLKLLKLISKDCLKLILLADRLTTHNLTFIFGCYTWNCTGHIGGTR